MDEKEAKAMLDAGYVYLNGRLFRVGSRAEADKIRQDYASALLGRQLGKTVLKFRK